MFKMLKRFKVCKMSRKCVGWVVLGGWWRVVAVGGTPLHPPPITHQPPDHPPSTLSSGWWGSDWWLVGLLMDCWWWWVVDAPPTTINQPRTTRPSDPIYPTPHTRPQYITHKPLNLCKPDLTCYTTHYNLVYIILHSFSIT